MMVGMVPPTEKSNPSAYDWLSHNAYGMIRGGYKMQKSTSSQAYATNEKWVAGDISMCLTLSCSLAPSSFFLRLVVVCRRPSFLFFFPFACHHPRPLSSFLLISLFSLLSFSQLVSKLISLLEPSNISVTKNLLVKLLLV
jgi:hypothetical protein